MDTAEIANKEFTIYSKAEADERGLDYVYWKEASAEDKWALTDDNYVMQVRSVKQYGSSSYIRLGGAVAWQNKFSKIHWEHYRETGNYNWTNPDSSWDKREAGKKRVERAIDALVASYVETGTFDWEMAGQIYRPNQQEPAATLKRLFHKERFRIMLQERLQEMYRRKGFTEEWVVDNIMNAAKTASENDDPLNQLRATEKGIELLGMTPGTITETTEQSADYSQNVLEGVKEYKAKLSQRKLSSRPENSPSIERREDDQIEPEDTD